MNYILEIKAFYDWLEVNRLPTSAIVLWHALMHIANKTGWKDNFTVAVVVLEMKTGLKKQAIMNARAILQNKGLLSFTSRSGNQSASYQLHSFVPFKYAYDYTKNPEQGFVRIDAKKSDLEYVPEKPIKMGVQKKVKENTQKKMKENMKNNTPECTQDYMQKDTPECTQDYMQKDTLECSTQGYTQNDTLECTQGYTQNDTLECTQGYTQKHTINKQNETKQNKTNLKEKVKIDGKSHLTPFFPLDSFEYKASEYLRDHVLSMIPNARVPQSTEELQKWAVHIERMKRLDQLSQEDIRSLIQFATADPFWQTNILSTQKLREKKDTLYAQMIASLKKKNSIRYHNGVDFHCLPKGARGVYEWMKMENDGGNRENQSRNRSYECETECDLEEFL